MRRVFACCVVLELSEEPLLPRAMVLHLVEDRAALVAAIADGLASIAAVLPPLGALDRVRSEATPQHVQ